MYRLQWLVLVYFVIAVTIGEPISEKEEVPNEIILSRQSMILTHVAGLHEDVEELRKDVQEQRKLIVQNQEQLKLTIELLTKLQQGMQQRRTESQELIGDVRGKQEQSIDLFGKIQLEIQKQREEIETDRAQALKWQSETRTSLAAIRNESVNGLKDVLDAVGTNHTQQEQNFKLLNTLQQEVEQQKNDEANDRIEFSNWHNESQKAIADIRAELMENVLEKLTSLDRDHKQIQNSLLDIQVGYQSCKDVPIKVSGKYRIRVNESFSFEAYCDQEQVGGGWMIIQQRWDGSENFNRKWNDYRNGFGEVDREHWLGLERIHQFMKKHDCELLVEMKDFCNNFKYARYSSFNIGSESEQYRLKTLGTYTGTAGDSLRYHEGMKFSTPDRDYDNTKNNCADSFRGGWWFNNCYWSFLNGLFQNVTGRTEKRISWNSFNYDYRGLYYSRMMIRPLN